VLNARRSGELTYVFAVNDRRTTGPYLGRYEGVLEQGVPIRADLQFREMPGATYDVLERRRLIAEPAREGKGCTISTSIEGGWGKLLAACPAALGPAQVSVPDRIQGAQPATVRVQARYASGRNVNAVVPLRFDLLSPDGELNDHSRFTATAEDGSWETQVPIADNEPAGTWTVRATELIGGHAQTAHFAVDGIPGEQRVNRAAPPVQTVAMWRFDGGSETAQGLPAGSSGEWRLRGASRIVANGKSGSCLECFRSRDDSKEGAEIAVRPGLSPDGRFSVELWLRPKPEMSEAELTFLLDCNYYLNTRDLPRANTGYALFLRRTPDGVRPTVVLGFGSRTATFTGKSVELQPGTWYRLGFAYNGAGRVTIYLDRRSVGGGTAAEAGPIAPAAHPLVIGGRVGSTHYGCAGYIDEVKLTTFTETGTK
jgi:hypothetical protein